MAQQTNIWGKMVSGTAGAAVGMKRAAHNAKQDGKVEDARKHISALTYEIGRLTVCGMDRGTAFEGPVAERYRKIQEAREEIRAFEAEKQRTKAVCPRCGEKVIAGMRYCGACGEELVQ